MVSSNKYIRFSCTSSYNPSVVNNVYASISQNTQNAIASAKNAVASSNAMINETSLVTTSKTESFLTASAATITSFDAVGTGMNALIECGTGSKITDGLGKAGRAFGVAGTGVSVISSGLTIKSGVDNWKEGSKIRGSIDFVVGSTSLFTTIGMTAGLISNPVGWSILGVTAVYGVGTMIYDLSDEY